MATEGSFRRRSKATSDIPGASLADIAFLLLIFFMVTTRFPRDRERPIDWAEASTAKKIDEKAGKVTLIHEELVDLEMPAMTMVFVLGDAAMAEQLEVGKEIEFTADRVNGKLTVTALK